ncbi:hypothetical protein [Streptacidiphilus fuscans]|uniref:Uncharacterized protein n=1 Tax=Streptacidiphilus fuscans TaxID=2789292 RepID=A0A931BBD6_9ACTN|nr:hypothetical protein [Streptacidiphilus fuscans]MBF9072511.1 hypothetical protein [Streptacidiphilus fuscans]
MTTAGEMVTGVLPVTPGRPRINLVEVGPALLKRMLQELGANPKSFYRLAIWVGDVPDDDLADAPFRAVVYDTGDILLQGDS